MSQVAEPAGTGVYVLGVTREAPAALADLPRLLPDRSLEAVVTPGLCALACTVPADLVDEHLADDLVRLGGLAAAHDRVLRALTGRTAVVPARLGSIYPSRRAVAEMLGRHRQALSATLDRLAGCSEWGVKILAADRPPAPGLGRPAAGEDGSGTAYLRRKRAEGRLRAAGRQAMAALVGQLHGDMAAVAQVAVTRPPQAPQLSGSRQPMLLNAAYLVDQADQARFTALVGDLAERHEAAGLLVELTGPWPPYSFAGSGEAGA